MKKITALLLCCLSLFLFTGCEGSTTSTEPKTETVENQELTLSMKDWDSTGLALTDIENTGTYTGEVVDGIPNGTGRFDTQNKEGTSWYYDGEFVNGVFQGQGTCVFDAEKELRETGTYENGAFTPTLSELVATGVNPKFCVKSISGANRAKFICCGSRLVRLPPCQQHNAGGGGCQGRRSRSFYP